MIFKHLNRNQCSEANGWVVAIDVIRAFTTAAYAFSQGAERILCTGETASALRLKSANPGSVAMGEEDDGCEVKAFEFNNSSAHLLSHDLTGKTVIQRTTAGTVGLVGPQNAKGLLACSLVNVGATIRYLQQICPEEIDFIETGICPDGRGDEDIACADYIESVLKGQPISQEEVIYRVLHSKEISFFRNNDEVRFPVYDLELATMIDRFDFIMLGKRISPDCVELRKVIP